MRTLLTIFISVSLAFSAPWPQAFGDNRSKTLSELIEEAEQSVPVETPPEVRIAFLQELINKTIFHHETNLANLEATLMCMDGVTKHCPDEIKRRRDILATQYPIYRRYLLLYNLVLRSQVWLHGFANKNGSSQPERDGLDILSLPQESPLTGAFASSLPQPSYTFEEAQAAIAGKDISVPSELYTAYFEQLEESVQIYERQFPGARCEDDPTCAKFLTTLQTGMTDFYKLNFGGILNMWCKLFYSGDQAVCTGLNPRLSVRYGTIYLDNLRTGQFNSQSSEGKRFRQFVIQTLGQFRFTTEKYLEKKIVQIVSMNPYVALVNPNAAGDSAEDKFSDAVIIEAFKKMTVEAKKALKIVNKRGHKALSKGNEKSMLPFMEYDLVAQSLISEPSGIYKRALEVAQMENIQSGGLSSENVYESVSVQYMKESMSHALKELGYVMLPALICLAPALKSLKVVQAIRAGKLLNSFSISACLGAHSLAANTFFLVDSYRLYDEAYATIFGTEDGQNLTKALATLSQSDRSLMMSWIFLPLGTGALAGPVGNRLSAMAKKIGPRNMQTVQRLAAKLRSSRAAQ